jgi:hypothetical protein
MAEERRSIEISYKANLKDLVSKLKTLPNITGQEAKKMVAQLDRQIKQAESAAKKATEAQKKAAKAAGDAFRRNAGAINSVQNAAHEASEKLEHVADSAGEVDRGFASIALALNQVNPAMGEAANVAADVAAVSEGLMLTIKNLNPLILAGATAFGVITLGLSQYFEAQKKAVAITLAMRDAQKDQNNENKDLGTRLGEVTDKYEDYKQSLDITTGAIDANTAAMILAEKEVRANFAGDIQAQEEYIKKLKEREKLLTRILNEDKAISEEEKETLKTLQLANSNIDNNLDLTKNNVTELAAVGNLRENIRKELEQNERALKGILAVEQQSIGIVKQELEFKKEQAAEEERINKAKKEGENRKEKSIDLEQQSLLLAQAAIDKELALKESKDRLFELTNDSYQNEIKMINDAAQASKTKAETEFQLHNDRLLLEQNLQAIQKQNIEELSELEDDLTKQRIDNSIKVGHSFVRVFDDATQATSQYLDSSGKMTEESAQALFRLQQASSLANIAMATAEGMQKAAAMGLPLGPIMAAGVGVAAAANAAVVLSEKPPTLHMGGIAPDETTKVLRGEAVLDRTTTRRLGDEGVRRLQNNNMSNEVVIIQPFKHIDRYNRSSRLRKRTPMGSGSY